MKDRIATRMIEAAEAERRAPARRHDRGADLGQHRRRAGDGGAGEGLPVRLRLPRQGQRGQAQRAQGVRRRGGRLPHRGRPRAPRLLLQRLRPARGRARARGSPTSTPTRTTRAPTTRPPVPRSGGRPRARSPTSSPASAPAARSAASAATSRSRTPSPGRRRRPGRLGLLRRHRPPLPRRGRGRGLLARDLRPRHRRPDHRGLRRRLVRLHPPAGPRGGAAGRRLVRHGGVRREAARPASSPARPRATTP